MFLNIGDQKITVSVPYDRQNFVRDTEEGITDLYGRWRRMFPLKTDREILAMVAFQFASHYNELKEHYEKAVAMAEECLKHADTTEETEVADEDDWMLD